MVISVLVEISFNNKEKTFDYLVPKDLENKIEIGKRVLVPFGKQNLEGFIIDIKKNSEYDLKEITSIIDEEPILNEELLNLGKELKKDLVCNLISIYQAMLPSGYKASVKTNINVKKEKYVNLLNERICNKLSKYPDILINKTKYSIPHILNISLMNIKPETFIHAMDNEEIYLSTNTACSSGETSNAVMALYNDIKRASHTIRISLSSITTSDEIDKFLKAFDRNFESLNSLVRKD